MRTAKALEVASRETLLARASVLGHEPYAFVRRHITHQTVQVFGRGFGGDEANFAYAVKVDGRCAYWIETRAESAGGPVTTTLWRAPISPP